MISVTRRFALCCCCAWNWLSAPTRLSCREDGAAPCSARRRDRGAGRRSSISTNSKFHTFCTTFIGRVGRPFAIRYRVIFGSAVSLGPVAEERDVSHGMSGAKGLLSLVDPSPLTPSSIVGRPSLLMASLGGPLPSPVRRIGER